MAFGSPQSVTQDSHFRHIKMGPEMIGLAVWMHARFPLSLRNIGGFLFERGRQTPSGCAGLAELI